jgi:hypothetical protein
MCALFKFQVPNPKLPKKSQVPSSKGRGEPGFFSNWRKANLRSCIRMRVRGVRARRESQCGRIGAQVRTGGGMPTDRASPRLPNNRLDAHGTRPLLDINPDQYRRAVWNDTNRGTTRRCCRACRAAPRRWLGSCRLSPLDQVMVPVRLRCMACL